MLYVRITFRSGGLSLMQKPKYKRIMLKISGEALAGKRSWGLIPIP